MRQQLVCTRFKELNKPAAPFLIQVKATLITVARLPPVNTTVIPVSAPLQNLQRSVLERVHQGPHCQTADHRGSTVALQTRASETVERYNTDCTCLSRAQHLQIFTSFRQQRFEGCDTFTCTKPFLPPLHVFRCLLSLPSHQCFAGCS